MLQIDHRESFDVDIFIDDPQLLPFLNPTTQSYTLAIHPDDYETDGTRTLKMIFFAPRSKPDQQKSAPSLKLSAGLAERLHLPATVDCSRPISGMVQKIWSRENSATPDSCEWLVGQAGLFRDVPYGAKKAKRTTNSAATICVAGCRIDHRPVKIFMTT